jgi:hypothetical protein
LFFLSFSPFRAPQVIKSNGYGFDLADAQSICLEDCPAVGDA